MGGKCGFFAGVDWASEMHDICVIDPNGQKLAVFRSANSAAGLGEMADKILAAAGGDPARIGVAIEVPRGPIVEMLTDRGFQVFSINPKQLDRFRDRHAPAGSKDDKLDAFVLADSLRTDEHCFRQVRLSDASTVMLRELSRVDEDLGQTMTRLANQLREQLMRFHPALLRLCPAADEPWFWSLIEAVGDPLAARRFKSRQAKSLLTQHTIRRWSVPEVLAAVRTERISTAPGTTAAAIRHARVAITQLRVVEAEQRQVRREIETTLETMEASSPEGGEPRDAAILRSLPGVGKIVAATVLAEAPQAIAERDYAAFRAHAGVAPITRRSGRRKTVVMRRACNDRLRNAIYHWSRISVQRDALSRKKYSALREKGHSHGRALRSVADGLLRMLFGMLRDRTLYRPEQVRLAA